MEKHLNELLEAGWGVELRFRDEDQVVLFLDGHGEARMYRGKSAAGLLARAWAGEPGDGTL